MVNKKDNDRIKIKLKGKCKWAFLTFPQTEGEFANGKYKLKIYDMDAESLDTLKKQNLKYPPQKDSDGDLCLGLSSNNPPKVIDANNNIIPQGTKIGNGSDVIVVASIYSNKFGTMAGLQACKVTKLVPYSGGNSGKDDDLEMLGVDPKSIATSSNSNDDDDDMPF